MDRSLDMGRPAGPSPALPPVLDDIAILKRCFRDIVALSTLPAMWSGADPKRIAESLASSLFTTLDPSLVYVGISAGVADLPIAVAQTGRYQVDSSVAAALEADIAAWARAHDPHEPMQVPASASRGALNVFTRAVGHEAELGVIAVGYASTREFPALHHLVLNVAATQAATAIQNARLLSSLRNSDDYLRAAIDSSAGGFYGIDPHGTTTICNASFLRMIGYARAEDVVGKPLHEVIRRTRADGTDISKQNCPIHRAAREGVPAHVEDEVFHRLDGTSFPVEYWSLPMVRGGEVRGAVTTFIDISERKRVQEALREADRRKDEFLATLSHELRNPLAPLRNSLHLLRLGGNERSSAAIHEMMERQVNHMVRLVDDLLEMSRINRGTFELRRERIEVSAVVRHALETSGPLLQEAGHRLIVSLPDEALFVDGDPVRLSQILANLLNNAARYTEAGGEVHVQARREEGSALISVRDNGIGIAPDALTRIFEMFNRGAQASRSSEAGLGIGLALARKLAEMHGGSVTAHSDGPAQGSEFVVRIPLAPAARAPGAAQVPDDSSIRLRRILVVDDNRDAGDSLAMLLRFLGAEVRIAHDGLAALEMLKSFEPNVVLLDIGMPGMDGYEVARRIRSDFPQRGITIVALSGWGQEEDRRRARDSGFDHHLIKPAEIATLQALLRSLEPEPSVLPAG